MATSSLSPRNLLVSGLDELQISIPDRAVEQLLTYFNELKKWSKKINLISQDSDQQIIETHFIDSLTLLPIIQKIAKPSLLDVGSGAGFPGLPLKIAHPELAVTLVEPRQKRVSFLNHICRTTGSKGVEIVCQRLSATEQIDSKPLGQFSIVTCRALTKVSEFLQMVHPYPARDGIVICMKGPQAEEEINDWRANNSQNFILKESQQLTLPFFGATRILLVFQKK